MACRSFVAGDPGPVRIDCGPSHRLGLVSPRRRRVHQPAGVRGDGRRVPPRRSAVHELPLLRGTGRSPGAHRVLLACGAAAAAWAGPRDTPGDGRRVRIVGSGRCVDCVPASRADAGRNCMHRPRGRPVCFGRCVAHRSVVVQCRRVAPACIVCQRGCRCSRRYSAASDHRGLRLMGGPAAPRHCVTRRGHGGDCGPRCDRCRGPAQGPSQTQGGVDTGGSRRRPGRGVVATGDRRSTFRFREPHGHAGLLRIGRYQRSTSQGCRHDPAGVCCANIVGANRRGCRQPARGAHRAPHSERSRHADGIARCGHVGRAAFRGRGCGLVPRCSSRPLAS